MRVQILKDYVKQNFPSSVMLDYALDVEKITTSKVLVRFIIKSEQLWNAQCFQWDYFNFFSFFHLTLYCAIYCYSCDIFQKPNLILNVDGFIGVAFVDLLRTCGGFTR